MKRLIIVAVLFVLVTTASAFPARKSRKPLVEFGPKASMYIGSVRLGLGAEILFHPMQKDALLQAGNKSIKFQNPNPLLPDP